MLHGGERPHLHLLIRGKIGERDFGLHKDAVADLHRHGRVVASRDLYLGMRMEIEPVRDRERITEMRREMAREDREMNSVLKRDRNMDMELR